MAYDLSARLTMRDVNFTSTMRRVDNLMRQASGTTERMTRALDRTTSTQRVLKTATMATSDALSRMGRTGSSAFSSMRSGASGLVGQVAAITAAYATAKTAATLFDKTIGGASRMELNGITLEALMNDQKKAVSLFDMLQKKAAISTLSDTDFMQMGKAFLPLTKQLKDIDKLTNISERLALSNPLQGAEGSAFAIREALSGDLVSLQERFNIPRSMLKDAFKGADTLTKKAAALDRVLNQMGYTQTFVTRVNKSASAQWDQLTSNVDIAMAKMGTKTLEKLKPVLVDLNKWINGPGFRAFTERGSQLIADGFDTLLSSAKTAWQYLQSHYFNNPAFTKLPDLSSKVSFIMGDLTTTFNSWLSGGGQDMLDSIGNRSVNAVAKAIEDNKQRLVDAGIVVGEALGQTIISSAAGAIDKLFTDPFQYGRSAETRKSDNSSWLDWWAPATGEEQMQANMDRRKRNMGWLDNLTGITAPDSVSKAFAAPSNLPKVLDLGQYKERQSIKLTNIKPSVGVSGSTGISYVPSASSSKNQSAKPDVKIESIIINAAGGDLSDPRTVDHIAHQLARRLQETH